MKIILLGPPGRVRAPRPRPKPEIKDSPYIHGDILREAIKSNTSLGQEAAQYVERGELVPDNLVTRMAQRGCLVMTRKEDLSWMAFPQSHPGRISG